MKPKISIMIPCFNRPDLLLQTLQSVKNQTTKPYEVVVIDNASTDDMTKVIVFCKKNKFSYIRNKKNVGFVGNWNNCIKKSRGNYLCILHSDDIITRDWCSKFSKNIIKNPDADVFSCALTLIDTKNMPTDVYYPLPNTGMLNDNFKEIFAANYNALSVSGSMTIKITAFKKTGLFKTALKTECDVWFYYKLMKECKIFYINEVLFGYKIHALQTIDKKVQVKTEGVKIAKLNHAYSIINLFYKKELKSDQTMRYFYLNHALVGYIIVFKYYLCLDFKTANKFRKILRRHFPDALSKMNDYVKLVKISVDYVFRLIKGKILVYYLNKSLGKLLTK